MLHNFELGIFSWLQILIISTFILNLIVPLYRHYRYTDISVLRTDYNNFIQNMRYGNHLSIFFIRKPVWNGLGDTKVGQVVIVSEDLFCVCATQDSQSLEESSKIACLNIFSRNRLPRRVLTRDVEIMMIEDDTDLAPATADMLSSELGICEYLI